MVNVLADVDDEKLYGTCRLLLDTVMLRNVGASREAMGRTEGRVGGAGAGAACGGGRGSGLNVVMMKAKARFGGSEGGGS